MIARNIYFDTKLRPLCLKFRKLLDFVFERYYMYRRAAETIWTDRGTFSCMVHASSLELIFFSIAIDKEIPSPEKSS